MRMPIWARTTIFAVVVHGTVTVVLPWLILYLVGDRLGLPLGVARHCGWPVIALGVVGYLLTLFRFGAEGHGTPAPWDAPTRLVAGGLYLWVRNPMYVAVLTILVGEAIAFASGALVLHAIAIWSIFQVTIVTYEEPVLRERFGEDFVSYCQRVRRWLPRPPGPGR